MTQMITDKGHTYEYLDDKTKMKITKDEITRENIVNAINIDDFTFETLLHKQKADEELTRDENYQIEKHIFKQFKYDKIDKIKELINHLGFIK